jgi:hypothetical protein
MNRCLRQNTTVCLSDCQYYVSAGLRVSSWGQSWVLKIHRQFLERPFLERPSLERPSLERHSLEATIPIEWTIPRIFKKKSLHYLRNLLEVCVKMRQLYILYIRQYKKYVGSMSRAPNNFDIGENNNLAYSNLIKHDPTYPNLSRPNLA